MQIRKATIADHELLLDMMLAFNTEESIVLDVYSVKQTLTASVDYPTLVSSYICYEGESIMGYAHVSYTFSYEHAGLEAAIDEIYIQSGFRRSGYASRFITDIEQAVKAAGAVMLRADVSDNKPWLYKFYSMNGFTNSQYRPFYKKL